MARIKLTIAGIAPDFPAFRVALVILTGMGESDSAPSIESFVRAVEEGATVTDTAAVGMLPEIQEWRRAYRGFGVKKTHYRNAAEALIRRLARDGRLPRVMPLVDLYNAISVKYRIPVGADDLGRLVSPMAFRYARDGDSFFDMRGGERIDDPPKSGEIVYADATKVLCRRWNWRQDARSGLGPGTGSAALVLQTLAGDGESRLRAAAGELAQHAADDLGARARWAIASKDAPDVTVDLA